MSVCWRSPANWPTFTSNVNLSGQTVPIEQSNSLAHLVVPNGRYVIYDPHRGPRVEQRSGRILA